MRSPAPFMAFVGCAFALAGGFFFHRSFEGYQSTRQSQSWPTAEGVILVSKLKTHTSRDSKGNQQTSTWAEIQYEYRASRPAEGGQMPTEAGFKPVYVSNQVSFRHDLDARDLVSRYPKGKAVQVHYDPQQPERAVLETTPQSTGQIALELGGSGAFLLIGLGLLIAALKVALSGRRKRAGR